MLYLRFKEKTLRERTEGVRRLQEEEGEGPYKHCFALTLSGSGAPPLTLPLTSPLSNKKPNQLNLANSNLEQRGLCRSPLVTEIKMVFISYVNILFSN